ncbi:hypothetical protein G6F59_013753 [Rhizopus arrhizus]|nr:hypothetical protein G6F59_013753 [Rhizopus arrhizus]
MQGAQHQVAGFGKRDGVVHAFAGTHLADHDHVRRLAQGGLQRRFPAVGIDADLALGDDAALVLVHELDRVFDGDDVAGRVLVAVTDHRCQRGRFTGTGSADEQDDAALGHRQRLDDRRQAQLFHGRNARLDAAQHHADLVALVEAADAEAADTGQADGEVAFVGLLEFLALCRRHHVEHQVAALLRRERGLGDRRDLAVDLHRRRHAGGDEQVRGALVRHQLEERSEIDGGRGGVHGGLPMGHVPGNGRWRKRHGTAAQRLSLA